MKRKSDYIWGKIMIYTGVLVLLISAGILAYNIWDENRAADSTARINQIMTEHIENNIKNRDSIEDPLYTDPEDNNDSDNTPLFIEINGERYIGILNIPVLSLELPVNYILSDRRLKETPCRYAGDINTSLVIAGHNYRRHFSPLAKLRNGDSVTLTDAGGVNHSYTVDKIVTMNATDIEIMLDSSYELTLFTCNFSGMARVAVRCVKNNS